jgi:membrane-associated phospholipid phosphatase
MNHTIKKKENSLILKLKELFKELLSLCKNKYFYIGLIALFLGGRLNFVSQTYLYKSVNQGITLPNLSDLILDNIPLWDVSFIYDLFAIISVVVFILYVIHKKEYNKAPYFLLICGIFHIVRAIFIVLTPLGNPPFFAGSDHVFNGFSKFELGVYPSGHIGVSFLLFLFAKSKIYWILLLSCVIVITIALLLSHAHYSIDILSGIFFAYAIKSFGDKYLTMFVIKTELKSVK